MNGLALFAGYGGLEIGIDAAFGGCRTVGYVERESYAAAALVARMEESSLHPAPIWDDVTTFDGREWRGLVDIISAGFPCQPFSAAGKQRGMDDERWLWDDIERIVREVRPRWFVGENVPGLVRLGLEAVLRSFAQMGYDVVWGAFRADQMGAAHKRERIFILARLGDTQYESRILFPQAIGEGSAERPNASGIGDVLAEGQGRDSKNRSRESCEGADHNVHPVADTKEARRGYSGKPRKLGSSKGQKGRPEDQSSSTAHGGERAVADGESDGRQGREARQKQFGRESIEQNKELADADIWRGRRRQVAKGRESFGSDPDARQQELADAGRQLAQSEDAGRQSAEQEPGADLSLFAPGPADLDLWARVLAESPSLEPSFCRVADGASEGMDYRQDRLRACGNGVVPLQAAVAIRTLAARAGWALI